MTDRNLYRTLTALYPSEFRNLYRDDLVQAHADIVGEHGRARGWARSALDLAITVPRYRLETIMKPRTSDTVILLIIGALIVLAVIATTDLGALVAIVPLALAAIIAITQRSRLARSLRSPDGNQRRRRLRNAAVLGCVCVVTLGVFIVDIGGDENWGGRAFVYINIFNIAFVAAIVYLIAGLLTRSPNGRATATPAVNR